MTDPTTIDAPEARDQEPNSESFTLSAGIRHSRIIPQTTTASHTLTIVMAVMCYLACLALGTLMVINKAVDQWKSDIASEIMVQIKPVAGIGIDEQIKTALGILRSSDGVEDALAISDTDAAALLEPWLGKGNILAELPVPRMITVTIDPASPPDPANLAARLQNEVPGATLDTHQQWQAQITRTAGTLRLIGYGVLILISLTTMAIVVFATRAALASNHEIVEVLHLVGAYDSFIGLQVQWHFLKLGLKSGIIGGIAGAATFLALGLLAGQHLPSTIVQGGTLLIDGPTAFGIWNYILFLAVPAAATIITISTAHAAVMRILSDVL